MLQPVRRRTWAPSGATPTQRAWDRHDRLSAVSFIGVSFIRHRLSLYFHRAPHNIDTNRLVALFRLLQAHYHHHVVVVLDRRNLHRCAVAYFDKHHPDWFTFGLLPAYAPELNPVEQCWNHTKCADLANFIPDDVDHLQQAIEASINEQRKDQKLLKSFFAFTKLQL